ncbi:MAG TPA: hypothetical protein VIL36_09290 [Acidimicrobiales bacterium]
MLDHLDDPNPPRPSDLTVERIVAEGARRLRRRRFAAGGALVVASTLAVVGMAVALQAPGDNGKVDTVGPSDGTSAEDDRDGGDAVVPPVLPDPDAPVGGPTTAPAPPSSTAVTGGGNVLVALVKDPTDDRVLVVRIDRATGAITHRLADYELGDPPPLCCIELAGDTVYYVVPAGQGDDEPADRIWRVGLDGGRPEPVTVGMHPAVSPDGRRLALVRDTPDGSALVVYDIATGDEEAYAGVPDELVRDVDWYDDGRLVFTHQAPEGAVRASTLDLADADTLADREPVGAPDGTPDGTSWLWIDRDDFGRVVIVRSCCGVDAGSSDGSNDYVLVLPGAGGEITVGSDLPFNPAGFAAGPAGEPYLLVDPPDGDEPGYGRLTSILDGHSTPIPGDHQVLAADW